MEQLDSAYLSLLEKVVQDFHHPRLKRLEEQRRQVHKLDRQLFEMATAKDPFLFSREGPLGLVRIVESDLGENSRHLVMAWIRLQRETRGRLCWQRAVHRRVALEYEDDRIAIDGTGRVQAIGTIRTVLDEWILLILSNPGVHLWLFGHPWPIPSSYAPANHHQLTQIRSDYQPPDPDPDTQDAALKTISWMQSLLSALSLSLSLSPFPFPSSSSHIPNPDPIASSSSPGPDPKPVRSALLELIDTDILLLSTLTFHVSVTSPPTLAVDVSGLHTSTSSQSWQTPSACSVMAEGHGTVLLPLLSPESLYESLSGLEGRDKQGGVSRVLSGIRIQVPNQSDATEALYAVIDIWPGHKQVFVYAIGPCMTAKGKEIAATLVKRLTDDPIDFGGHAANQRHRAASVSHDRWRLVNDCLFSVLPPHAGGTLMLEVLGALHSRPDGRSPRAVPVIKSLIRSMSGRGSSVAHTADLGLAVTTGSSASLPSKPDDLLAKVELLGLGHLARLITLRQKETRLWNFLREGRTRSS